MVGGMQVLLVLLLIGYSQEQGSDEVDCVSREEFGRVTAEIDTVDARLQGIKDELDMGQKGIVDILSQLQTDVRDIHSTINNNSLLHDERQQVLLQGVAQNTSLIQLTDKVEEIRDNSALQHTELEEELGEITQELSEIKANQHTSLTQLSDQLSDEVQEIRDNSALQHTDLEEQLGGITQEQANQHTSLTELSDHVQEIHDSSALRHTNAEEQLREIARELSQIKANQYTPVSGTFQNPAPSCHYTNLRSSTQ